MNRSFLLQTSLISILAISMMACGRRVTAASSQDGDTGPLPATTEPDFDTSNFKVEHPEQFPLTTAGEYVAAPELM